MDWSLQGAWGTPSVVIAQKEAIPIVFLARWVAGNKPHIRGRQTAFLSLALVLPAVLLAKNNDTDLKAAKIEAYRQQGASSCRKRPINLSLKFRVFFVFFPLNTEHSLSGGGFPNDPFSIFAYSCNSPAFIEHLLRGRACGQEYPLISRQQGYS